MPAQKEDAWDRILKPWWSKLIIGSLMVAAGWWIFDDFAKLESGEKHEIWIQSSTKFLYNVGGKWLVASLPVIAGLGIIAWGVAQVSSRANK